MSIKEILKPGDVILEAPEKTKWWQIHLKIIYAGIFWFQKRIFGKNSNWKFTHSTLYFDDEHIFSITFPKTKWLTIENYKNVEFSIFRPTLKDPVTNNNLNLTKKRILIMKDAADRMIGTDYDIGQLFDIAIKSLLNFEKIRKLSIFDFGKKKKVCSVGVRVCFEKMYQKEKSNSTKLLFSKLNKKKYLYDKVSNFKGIDVEATSPAHFANTDHYNNEFKLIYENVLENNSKFQYNLKVVNLK